MTREDVEARIVELQKLHDQAVANMNALRGAIQDCEFWLQRMAHEIGPSEEPPKPRLVEGE